MKLDIEYEIWRFDELYHGFEMDAKENLPAGSMLCKYDESVSYTVQRFFHREKGNRKMTENEKALNSLKRLQELTHHLPTKRAEDREAMVEAVFDYVEASCSYKKAQQCMKMAKTFSLEEVIAILEKEVSYDVEYHAGNQELPY